MSEPTNDILAFWFGNDVAAGSWKERRSVWFAGGPDLDNEIGSHFGDWHESASRGELSEWQRSAHGSLALILLLDQFTRNLYRGTADAFSQDGRAQAAMQAGIDAGQDEELEPIERAFFYMPCMHAEDLQLQNQGVELFTALSKIPGDAQDHLEGTLKYAIEHRDLLVKFGRFPHRNPILKRTATADEEAYLAQGGATFGQTPKSS